MKRIILALAMVIAAGTLAYSTTRAVWTDTVTVSANQVVTGTTDLQVSTNDGVTWDQTSQSSSFSLTGLVPGQTSAGAYAFSLKNLSADAINFALGGRITPATVITGAPDKSKLSVQVYNYDTPAEATAWKTLSEWEAAAAGGIDFSSTLNQGATKKYGLKVKLDATATNEWQGKTVTFSMEVTGTQVI